MDKWSPTQRSRNVLHKLRRQRHGRATFLSQNNSQPTSGERSPISEPDLDFVLPEITITNGPLKHGLEILDKTTMSTESIKLKQPPPVKLDTSIKKIKHAAFTQEINTIQIRNRQRSLAATQVSESIMKMYRGRNHPPWEVRKSQDNPDSSP